MQCKIYKLPEINFVGGDTQELRFNLKEPDGSYYNADHISNVDFSVCNYSLKTGEPLFSLTPTQVSDAEDAYPHAYKVVIPASATKELCGKYIYQITFMDDTNKVEIPSQGIMNITRNIHQDFITA